jgi:hypothetical protein
MGQHRWRLHPCYLEVDIRLSQLLANLIFAIFETVPGSSATYIQARPCVLRSARLFNATSDLSFVGNQIQISSIIINSLPPTSRRPLIVKPFVPVETFIQTLPTLLSKGKEREVTSDVDYALLEGLVVGASVSILTA